MTTLEQAQFAATEWAGDGDSLIKTWLINAIMDEKQHRDIGKLLAQCAEIHVNQWLTERLGRQVVGVVGKSHDSETVDEPRVRFQVKFRMGSWHLETTRRNSAKNASTSSTGHVAYKSNEFDILCIFVPGPHFGVSGSKIRCIPVEALVNPTKPDQLVPRINKPIRTKYDNEPNTENVISELKLQK